MPDRLRAVVFFARLIDIRRICPTMPHIAPLNMSTTFVINQSLTAVTCANCGVLFAMPELWNDKFRENHQTFYCPAGHTNFYPGETEAEKLKREVAKLQSSIEYKDALIVDVRKQRDHAEHQRNGMKGALRRTAVRVKNGVCPCCKRTFSCLADHMATKHPSYACEKVSP